MRRAFQTRLVLVTSTAGLILAVVFVALVIKLRSDLAGEMTDRMVARAAGILGPVAQRQFEREQDETPGQPTSNTLVSALLASARQEGMLSLAVFDADGATLEAVPGALAFVELTTEDFVQLSSGRQLSRFHQGSTRLPDPLPAGAVHDMPVLEVSLPIMAPQTQTPVGFVRYLLDGRPLAADLALINDRLNAQTQVTLAFGLVSIAGVLTLAHFGLRRAQKTIDERNARLLKTEVELSLAERASAMGQITSHLMHGVQGAVAGLRSAVDSGRAPDWESVSDYTARLQAMTTETLNVLGDLRSNAAYSLTGEDLGSLILERNRASAKERSIELCIENRIESEVDSRRGGILCLIADNLVQNAIQMSPRQSSVKIALDKAENKVFLRVSDQGDGIPDGLKERLFQPGFSTRPGGTGLGLALSRLLARQLNGELTLVSTGRNGSCFELSIPV